MSHPSDTPPPADDPADTSSAAFHGVPAEPAQALVIAQPPQQEESPSAIAAGDASTEIAAAAAGGEPEAADRQAEAGTDAGTAPAADAGATPGATPETTSGTTSATDAGATADAGPGPDPAPQPAAPVQPAIADLAPAACAAALAERFPALFTASKPLPIKLRIQADIQQRAPGLFNKKSLSIFLHRHTTSTAYIRALLAAEHRFDLDGQAAGEISEEHKTAATVELERRRAIVQARRQAERAAGRPAARAAAGSHTGAAAATGGAESGPDQSPVPASGEEGNQRNKSQRPKQRHDRPRTGQEVRHPGQRRDGQGNLAAPARQAHAEGNRHAAAARGEHTHQAHHARQAHQAHQDNRDSPGSRPATARTSEASHRPPPPPPQAERTPEQAAEDLARRERLALLRSYESNTLSKANFLVLKRISEADLDAQLALAKLDKKH